VLRVLRAKELNGHPHCPVLMCRALVPTLPGTEAAAHIGPVAEILQEGGGQGFGELAGS
jgi:hypothetical protein